MAKGIPLPVTVTNLDTEIGNAVKKVGTINIPVSVDPTAFKKLAQPLGRVSGLATEFEKSIAASNARVIAFGASVGIINGVQNAFASLVKTTIEVEKSLTNIAVISGKTTEELQPFSRALFEIAKTTSQSFQTASEAALEFSRQGLSLDETLKRTQDALTLTRFTSLSAAEAVDVLTAAANSFGETGITTSEILNKLVAVDTKFAVSAEDLAKGLSRAGSIAQEVGVNFDELNAIVTIAQERTARGGAVIGNAFKTIFTRIRSDETIQALQSIGIYSFDAEGRLKPVVGLLEELAGKISTLSETKRIEVLESIASKYNINVLTALVDDLGSTTSKFREARDISAGAQNEAYQRQIEFNKTLDAVITRVTNSAAQLADTLGKIGVTDSLKSLLNFFDNILTGINDVIDSEGIGGTIAKGLISGLSGVFFKIGIPLLLAIFVKLTKDIAQFGTESLKTILGINKEVRERQALEQAVVNTLIKDQQVMATILSLSGDRAKQERYLLSVYNEQLAALQKVQSIAAGVAPALQAAGLSATSGTVRRRAAEGYLPAAEAKDVRRGVGGASPSSKVVEIPNFSFGGGKRGTMVANTSEYIVPNYAGGSGTAIFNQDMAKEYGLPPGAKKITASGGFVPASGFVPNFAAKKFNVFDRLRNVKKNADPIDEVSIEGMQKSAYLTLGDKVDPVGRFSELQTSAKQRLTDKLGEIASNAKIYTEQGKIEFVKINDKFNSKDLYGKVKAVSDKKRNKKKIEDSDIDSIVSSILPSTEGSIDEDVRASIRGDVKKTVMSNSPDPFKSGFALEDVLFKKFTGIAAAKNNRAWDLPARQSGSFKKTFGFSSEFGDIKSGTSVSSISSFIGKHINAPTGTNASRGYIPNFAELNDKGIYAGLVGETAPDNQSDVQSVTKYVTPTEKGLDIYDTGIKSADSVTFDVYRVPRKNEFKLKSIREALGNTGKNLAIDLAREVTGGALGNNIAEEKLAQTFNPGSLQGFANTIFEASVGALLSDKSFQDYTEQATNSLFDLNIAGNSLIKKNFGIKDSVNALEVKGASTPKLLNSIAEKIYKSTAGGKEAFTKRGKVYIEDPGRANNKSIARAFVQGGTPFVEIKPDVFEQIKGEFDPSKYKLLKNPPEAYRRGALGYVPNYADPSTSLAIEKISDSSLQGKLDMAAEKAYGGFTEKRPIKAGVSKRFAAGTQNTPATLKFREALEKKGAGLEPLLNRPYGFMGLQLSTAPAGATFSISDPESVRKFNNPFPTEPEASRKPALVAVANYREPTRDEIKKGIKPDVVAPQGQYANVSYATMFGAPVQLPALGVKSPAKKASFGYVPNFADLFVDYDYTIFGKQVGKVDEFNNQRALINEVTEKEAKGMTEEQLNAREEARSAAIKKQKDLLTPFGQKLLQSKKPFKLATARWNDYQPGIESSLKGLGFNVNGIFALGREFSEEQYKVDNPKFAEEMKKPEGERNTRVKPRIEPSAAQKKALFFKERAPQIATGDIDFVDNDVANLQAVKSLMPKINTFTPDQYMAKLLAPQEVKGIKASLGYVPNFVSENAKAAIGRLIREGATPGERAAAEAAKERALKQKAGISRSLLTLDDENFLETQGGSIEKAMGFGLNPILEKLQNIRNGEELQNSDSAQIKNLKEKIGIVNLQRVWKMIGNQESKRLQVQKALIEKRYPTRIQGAALGYIPNFAQNDPLKEAIGREVAAGVPPARVRVTQDGRLKNRDNPDGLAVINTRDEPNGKIPNDFRERGMRAAMATRGFVPNFALTRDNKTKTPSPATPIIQKFEKDISQIPSFLDQASTEQFKSAVSGLITNIKALSLNSEQLKSKIEKISEGFALTGQQDAAFRSAVNSATQEIENRKNAEKKAWQETNKQVTSFKPSNIVTSGGVTGGSVTGGSVIGGGAFDKLGKIDIGKFILLQSAVVGVTSALQSATEQGSALGNSLEVTSAAVSGAATSLSLLKTGLGPIGIVAAGVVTALTQLTPLFIRLYEEQKTPAERAAEALSKLAKEAEKTGRKISPEEFLAVFEEQDKITKAKQQEKTGRRQIDEFLSQQGINANDETISQLYGIANTLDFISKDGKVNQEKLKELITTSSKNIAVRGGSAGTGYVATQTSVDIGTTIKAAREKVLEKRLADVRKPQTEDRTDKTIKAENELLKIKFGILDNIVKKELEINKAYADRIRGINSENTALERAKGIITERQFAELQASQEREKVRAEEAKAISENANNLRSSLAGLKDEGLGNIFGEADVNKLQGLLEAFKTGGGVGSEAFGKAFEAATARVGQNGEPIAGTNIAQLSSQTQQDIYKNLSDAANNEARARSNAASRIADVNQNLKDFRSSTQILTDQTNETNAIIAGTTVLIGKLNKSFSGAAKYEELLGGERAKLANSLSKAVLQNKTSLDLAEENFASEVALLALKSALEEELRKRVPIEARAAKDEIELNRATAERIDQLKKDAINAGPRLKSQRDILDAESGVIEAEEDLFKNGVDLANVSSLRRNMLIKLTQSERKAEEENQASIGMIRQKVQADRDAIDRQTNLIEAENGAYDEEVKKANIISLRRSVLTKLIQSERKAEEENQVSIDTVRQRYQASLGAIRRQAALTEEENRSIGTTADLNAVTAGLTLARAKLIESNRKAEEQNLIDIAMARENFDAEANSLRRKRKLNESLLEATDQEDFNRQATIELMAATTDLAVARRKAVAALDPDNLKKATGNKIIDQTTQNLNQISAVMVEGGALTDAGVQGDYEKQANARIIARRMGGRTDLTYAESEDILKGRGETITDKLGRSGAMLMDEAQSFQDIIGKSTPKLFADGMAEAMQTALNQADNLGEALRGVAMSFLKNLQSAFLQSASQQIVASILPKAAEGGYVKGYASGGLVTGGSGYKDDVPAMLSQGEYVIRKSSVEKYGAHNLSKLNSGEPPRFADGGIFLPGVRGQGQISGYKDLTAFANQRTTSGATDVLSGSDTSAFASLEDQSSRLSAYALMNEDDTINQEIRSAQEQARNIMAEREAYRTAERKAFQKQLVGTVASAALSFGTSKLMGSFFGPKTGQIPDIAGTRELTEKIAPYDRIAGTVGGMRIPSPNIPKIDLPSPTSLFQNQYGKNFGTFDTDNFISNKISSITMPRIPGKAYGGMIPRFADGGSPTDKVPALVMGGEYIMSEKATKKYGKQFFDSINQGRAPRFADGGQVSTSEPSFAEKAAASSDSKASSATNVSININVTGGTSESQSQGDTKQDGIDYKKMSEQIKQIVITTINEEKRLGGSLRPRG